MAKISNLALVRAQVPGAVNGTVAPPSRRPNRELRPRGEHLTPTEVDRLLAAARERGGRYAHRDYTLVLLAYRHGLRVSEIVALRWDQVDFEGGVLHVVRSKKGSPSTHPVRGIELRALRRLQREQKPTSPYVLTTERGGAPMSPAGVRKLVARIGQAAGLPFPIHPHMLRHSTGYFLANRGEDTRAIQSYLGHRNIAHTTRYTELAPGRFKAFWQD